MKQFTDNCVCVEQVHLRALSGPTAWKRAEVDVLPRRLTVDVLVMTVSRMVVTLF